MTASAVALIATLTLGVQAASQGVPGPPKPGTTCTTKGEQLPGGFVCVKKKGKLVWAVTSSTSGTAASVSPTASATGSAASTGSSGFTKAKGYAAWSPTSSNAFFSSGSQPVGSQVSTSKAAVGSIFLCRAMNGPGGASAVGPWVVGSRWYPGQKVKVDGARNLNGSVSGAVAAGRRVISGNGLPATSLAGDFPISSSSTAYKYDRNPNSIQGYSLNVSVPAEPQVASSPSCVDGGAIGYTTNGVAIYNALDGGSRDAAAYETLDKCWGHPEMSGQYHFHTMSTCVGGGSATVNSPVWGFMLDGFPITGPWENGVMLKTADLDVCHGKVSTITLDGASVSMYHYVATEDYPYTAGCYRGSR
jgi:hypothetical protein